MRMQAGRLLSCARLAAALGAVVGALAVAGPALATSQIVVSQVYGGGGNSGATYTHDFIELYNRGATTLFLDGWSLQYGSSAGNIGPTGVLAQITPLSGPIAPGQYVLVREAQGTGGSLNPGTDVDDATPIAIAGGRGQEGRRQSPPPR